MIKKISVEIIEFGSHELVKKTINWNEPIPEFNTRYPNILESCVKTPFQTYGGKDLYKNIEGKGGVLFYLMIKNHPFQNGNKRIAITTLLMFLFLNDKWLEVSDIELYNFAVWVAQSPRDAKDDMLTYISKFVKKHLVNLK